MSIESMTGYGSATFSVAGSEYRLDLKSVNHKGASLRVRIPSEFAALEIKLRKTLTKRLLRGAIDLSIHREQGVSSRTEIQVNEEVAKRTMETLQNLAQTVGAPAPTLALGLKIGHFAEAKAERATDEEAAAALTTACAVAIDGLLVMRRQEGDQLEADLNLRLRLLGELLTELENEAPAVMTHYETRMKKRLEDAAKRFDVEVDPGRLNAELILFSDRSDVTEETVRARGHLVNAGKLMDSDGREKGKRFDFLAQELFREFNTIGSKCRDLGMASVVISAKVELEKLREQVQNIV